MKLTEILAAFSSLRGRMHQAKGRFIQVTDNERVAVEKAARIIAVIEGSWNELMALRGLLLMDKPPESISTYATVLPKIINECLRSTGGKNG